MSEDIQRVKERIAKLMAMAKDSSSPNEAQIAAGRARALMDKYQLDEYDIDAAKASAFATEGVTRAYATMPYHLSILAVAVAKYNDCQCFLVTQKMTYKMQSKANQSSKEGSGRTKAYGKVITFRGYEQDVVLAKAMFEMLCGAIDKALKGFMVDNHSGRYSVRIGSEFKTNAARALIVRFDAMTVEREKLTATTGTALVVIKAKSIEQEFGEVGYKSKSRSISRSVDYEDEINMENARSAGYAEGQKIEIIKRLDD